MKSASTIAVLVVVAIHRPGGHPPVVRANVHRRPPMITDARRVGWGIRAATKTTTTPSSSVPPRGGGGRRRTTALILFPRGGGDDDDEDYVESREGGSGIDLPASEGGGTTTTTTPAPAAAAGGTGGDEEEGESLDDRVFAAMRRLGLDVDVDVDVDAPSPADDEEEAVGAEDCEGGACAMRRPDDDGTSMTTTTTTALAEVGDDASMTVAGAVDAASEEGGGGGAAEEEDTQALAKRISIEMSVPREIAAAAVYSTLSTSSSSGGGGGRGEVNEAAARSVVQNELDAVSGVPEDCDEVRALADEGHTGDVFLVRRALAFSEMNVDDARAILVADREDEEAEEEGRRRREEMWEEEEEEEEEEEMRTVTVDYPEGFDPLKAGTAAASSVSASSSSSPPLPSPSKPPPAKIEEVVFEGTAEDLQRLVIDSPVPVLLDVYADWCGPCKQLTPALEQICVNAGGMIRLVKVNTDQQRSVSGCLDVKALPTVFGIRDGKVVNSFEGMPRDEKAVRDFLMGMIVPGQKFNPPLTSEEEGKYEELSSKLLKLASASSFSFSSRERLQGHVSKLLDELVETAGGGDVGMSVADDSAKAMRSLMSNVINHPFDEKYRKVKLDNRVVAAKIACHPSCVTLLGRVGFVRDDNDDGLLIAAKGRKVANIAPIVVGRDSIDRWIDRNRSAIAAAGRKRRDEAERARLAAEAEAREGSADEEEEEEEEEEEDDEPDVACVLKLRLDGTKKTHDVTVDADDTLGSLLGRLPFPVDDGATLQFTCVARRLVARSTDAVQMSMTLSQLKLTPSASVVVRVMGEAREGDDDAADAVVVPAKGGGRSSLAERAASHKKKVTGSHSMHSIGLYAKDDGLKGETFESGGVLYEHVVSDDEGENVKEEGGDDRGESDDAGAPEEEVNDEP